MYNRSFNYSVLLAFTISAVLTSCKKDDPEQDQPANVSSLEVKTVSNVFANDADGHYAFFSLRTNSIVPLADSATSEWDVAFYSTRILTNGGTSGDGMGGAAVVYSGFSDVGSAPDDASFHTDNGSAFAIPTGSGNGWYNYDGSTNLISPIPGRTLVIRTANGHYAKIEILSYYKDAPASPTASDEARYYTFRFSYQPDGSKKLN